jgi:hypothetical protein
LDAFLIKLAEKKQSNQQRHQTQKAIQLYQRSLRQNSVTRRYSEDKSSKENPPAKSNEVTSAPSLKKELEQKNFQSPVKKTFSVLLTAIPG